MEDRSSTVELVRDFFKHHSLAFAQAAKPQGTEGHPLPPTNQFEFSPERFDEWAVAGSHMQKRLSDATELEHGGVLFERHRLRDRMNRASRRGQGIGRAFTIEARGRKWRVVLLEQYVVEQPAAIVRGIRQCLERSERSVDQVKAFLSAQEHLSQEDQLRCLMRLDMAQMFVFNGLQMLEMMVMGFDAASPPNLKRLRRKMAEVLLRESRRPAKAKRIGAA